MAKCEILKHKHSKLNALSTLKEEKLINETRVLDLSRKDEFNAFHINQVASVNKAYGLELEALYTVESNSLDRLPYEKVYNERVVPIDEAFEQVDEARKKLGIYENKLSYGEYIKREREIERQEMESAKYDEIFQEDIENEADRVSTFITTMGEQNTKNHPDGLFQEEGGITPFNDTEYDSSINSFDEGDYDLAINVNPVLGASSYVTPTFDRYLEHKEALLKKVNASIQRLYEVNKEEHSIKNISRINELNDIKTTLERDIDNFKNGVGMFDLVESFFKNDIQLVKNLLADANLDNLFLAEDMFTFLENNMDVTRINTMFHINSNQLNLPEITDLLDSISSDIRGLKKTLNDKFDELFLELLDKHVRRFEKFTEYQGMSAQEIRNSLMEKLTDTSIVEAGLLSVDKEMTAKSDLLSQLIRLELEIEQEKEKIVIQPIIEEINDTLKEGEKELSRLGMFFTSFGAKLYDYNIFKQKDEHGGTTNTLVEKFSATWNTFLKVTNSAHSKKMRELRDPTEIITQLNSHFDTMDHNVEWVNFSLLHDIFDTDPRYDEFKDDRPGAADNYKSDLIGKIGQAKYDDLLNEQRYNLDLFMQMKENMIKTLLRKEGVATFAELSDRTKVNFQITSERNNPMSFIQNRINVGDNQVPVTVGTMTYTYPSYIKYNIYIPKSTYYTGANTNFYDADYEQIENNPILLRMYDAYKSAIVATNNRVVGSNLDLDPLSILSMSKNFRETLIDKNWIEIAKAGLSHFLNVKQFLKNQFSNKPKDRSEENKNRVDLGGQIRSFNRIVSNDYEFSKTALKNILNVNLNDNSKINFLRLSADKQAAILKTLGLSYSSEFTSPQGEFLVSDLIRVSQQKILSQQTNDLPTMLKAHLEIASEHRSRVNTKGTVDIIKNRIDKNDEGSVANKNRNNKRNAFVNKLVLNKDVNKEWLNISEALKGDDTTDYIKYKGILGRFFYKNLTAEEKGIYDVVTKRITNIEGQLATLNNVVLIEKLVKEREKLEGVIERLGKDYTGSAFIQATIVKAGMLGGLAWNIVAPFKNFINGMSSLMMRDGNPGFWNEGNAGVAMNHILFHNVKRLSSKHAEEWKKTVLFIESLRIIENQTTEIQKSENNSKVVQAGNLITDGMYLTKKVEWVNQSVSLIARAMDQVITHPTILNTDGTPYSIPLFNGTEFEAHEIVDGKLKLKQEWTSDENKLHFEQFSSPEMLDWKIGNKSILASLNGDYSQEGSTMIKQEVWGKPVTQFKTWLPNYLYDRYAYNQKSLSTGTVHDGFYIGPLIKAKTSASAKGVFAVKAGMAVLTSATFLSGAGLVIPLILMGYAANRLMKASPEQGLTSIDKQYWNQAKYLAQSMTLGTATTGINFITSILAQKNFIPIAKSNFEKSLTSEQDKKDFANLQLLAKSAQFNILLALMSMAAMAIGGDDEEKERKGKDGSKQRARYLKQQKEKEEGTLKTATMNGVKNVITNLYNEMNFADNPVAMYQAMIQNNGVSSMADRIAKLSIDIASGEDEIKSGENAGESKVGNNARKQLPMIIRNIGQENYNFGLESITRKDYETGSIMNKMFNTDFKNTMTKARKERKAFKQDKKIELKEEHPDMSPETIEKRAQASAKKHVKYPKRSKYDADQNLKEE